MDLKPPAPVTAPTPGKAAHDTWCADDDWDQLDDEARDLWEDTAQAGHAVIVAQETHAGNKRFELTAAGAPEGTP
jgi:hypothetical protein